MQNDTIAGERTCPVCKKQFVVWQPNYTYRIKNRYGVKSYCSYTCWRKAGGGHKEPSAKIKRQLAGVWDDSK